MKHFHVHIAVENIKVCIDFYSKLFDQQPTKQQEDYAKWMLEDPRINFAISARGHSIGLNHFGFQVDSSEELDELRKRGNIASAGNILDQGKTTCCYAKSEKYWMLDPQGLAWEYFHTMADILEFGDDTTNQSGACCIPVRGSELDAASAKTACCIPNGLSVTDSACCG
ncbi:ArsI/CadI family heavy metal resistance metalloenzyme [Methylomonas sp. UP202]|uniref:ArsI/CadI family heavy metal resistance metalloenzyme n=1 Tax=Methylomonas sp. UP202 TaxID=3040943 RepID=UPI0024791F7A|nr:ArsI/CadI family heavy metal resistance metalloenzyme [Methylomonas sp. UP202]WGS83886.1 ArsI/CadI family heavy metal resistance metalloenzyme [Methylomonas sp. UP202]